MNKKQFVITLIVVCVFSFLGGIAGSKYGIPDIVEYHKIKATFIETEYLDIIDERGNIGITLTSSRSEPRLSIYYDKRAKVILGTNNLVSGKENKEEVFKGSLCFFDFSPQGNRVIKQLP